MGCNNGQARREVIAALDEISEYRANGFSINGTHRALKDKGLITCQKTAFYKWVQHFEKCDPETYPSRTKETTALDLKPKSLPHFEEGSESSAPSSDKVVKVHLPTLED
ncbi:hypothetical protein [Terasakiella pusilla]|jgi:hypothetical protein|uniref:hypothetical protein n=1 Tax=Terasakiella pusilla TaxID=64973 RepID=UPI003AA7DD5B